MDIEHVKISAVNPNEFIVSTPYMEMIVETETACVGEITSTHKKNILSELQDNHPHIPILYIDPSTKTDPVFLEEYEFKNGLMLKALADIFEFSFKRDLKIASFSSINWDKILKISKISESMISVESLFRAFQIQQLILKSTESKFQECINIASEGTHEERKKILSGFIKMSLSVTSRTIDSLKHATQLPRIGTAVSEFVKQETGHVRYSKISMKDVGQEYAEIHDMRYVEFLTQVLETASKYSPLAFVLCLTIFEGFVGENEDNESFYKLFDDVGWIEGARGFRQHGALHHTEYEHENVARNLALLIGTVSKQEAIEALRVLEIGLWALDSQYIALHSV